MCWKIQTIAEKTKEHPPNGKISQIYGWEDLILLRCQYYAKMISRFNTILIKISTAFFTEMEKPMLKSICNCKEAQITQTIFKKKNKNGGLTFPDFDTY